MNNLNSDNLQRLQAQFESNPLFKRAEQMASGKNENELEQIARNLCQQRGIDYDTAWNLFKKQFNI